MELSISYGVIFGKCDASDWIEYDTVVLNEEESKAAMIYALTDDWDSILELVELQEKRDDLYSEIEETEIENGLENDDEYTMECQGTAPMDIDDLNDLVHGKDEHAISFFGLEDADDEEIEEWDASELDELPTIAEFDPDFEPYSPYDEGWILRLSVSDVTIDENELLDFLKDLFSKNELDKVNDIISNCTVEFERSIDEIVLEIAKEMNCKEYIDSLSNE